MNPDSFARHQILNGSGWSNAVSTVLAGDASQRSYERLTDNAGNTSILMTTPPGYDILPFVRVAGHLEKLGLSAPRILAQDPDAGLLLLEDFGDALFSRLLARSEVSETDLYLAAIDVLIGLRSAPMIDCPVLDAPAMAEQAGIVFNYYAGADPDAFTPFLQTEFARLSNDRCLALRDFHCDNLIWLDNRAGMARVGLLDFQDAVITHPAYDLASLLKDARRDLGDTVEETGLSHYIAKTGVNDARFRFEYALVGVQRNLRILGVFARLSTVFDKPQYIDFIPRVWRHLWRDLSHPELVELKNQLALILPEPTEDFLRDLRNR